MFYSITTYIHYGWFHQDRAVDVRLVLVFQVRASWYRKRKQKKEKGKRCVFDQLQVSGDRLGEYLLLGPPSR